MDKRVYIIIDHDNDKSKWVSMSEEQAKAINWLIDWADLDMSCEEPRYSDVEEL